MHLWINSFLYRFSVKTSKWCSSTWEDKNLLPFALCCFCNTVLDTGRHWNTFRKPQYLVLQSQCSCCFIWFCLMDQEWDIGEKKANNYQVTFWRSYAPCFVLMCGHTIFLKLGSKYIINQVTASKKIPLI